VRFADKLLILFSFFLFPVSCLRSPIFSLRSYVFSCYYLKILAHFFTWWYEIGSQKTHHPNFYETVILTHTDTEMNAILDYLMSKRGIDFSGCRSSMIERRIRKRLAAVKSASFSEYLKYLQECPGEPDNLIDVLTINVSRFFRDTLTFEYIADNILPAIVTEKVKMRDHSLRVWSAGCATGEEPYSVAILINELFKKEEHGLSLNIFATDIDKGALTKAQRAVYPFESVKNVKYGILKKYFTVEDESFMLNPGIKKLVTFTLYDILDKKNYAPPESVFGNFDMVLCRNLLIYFSVEYQNIIFDKLYRSLDKKGHLVLGETEMPTMKYQKYFRRVDACCHIYQKR